jgi:hypothetical protein
MDWNWFKNDCRALLGRKLFGLALRMITWTKMMSQGSKGTKLMKAMMKTSCRALICIAFSIKSLSKPVGQWLVGLLVQIRNRHLESLSKCSRSHNWGVSEVDSYPGVFDSRCHTWLLRSTGFYITQSRILDHRRGTFDTEEAGSIWKLSSRTRKVSETAWAKGRIGIGALSQLGQDHGRWI